MTQPRAPKTEPVTTVELPAMELIRLLVDTQRMAGKDTSLPMLAGVVLHSTAHDDATRLHATATNRFILGQSWASATGHLPVCFLDHDAIRLVVSVLRMAGPAQPATLHLTEGELDLTVAGVAHIMVPTSPYRFPSIRKILDSLQEETGMEAVLAPDLVAQLVQVARARRQRMVFTFGQPGKPSTIDIGPGFRALLMPVRETPAETFEWAPPPQEVIP